MYPMVKHYLITFVTLISSNLWPYMNFGAQRKEIGYAFDPP